MKNEDYFFTKSNIKVVVTFEQIKTMQNYTSNAIKYMASKDGILQYPSGQPNQRIINSILDEVIRIDNACIKFMDQLFINQNY